MPAVSHKHFIDELKFTLSDSDLIKAKALLQYFKDVDPKIQDQALCELSKADEEIAFHLLGYLAGKRIKEKQVKDKLYLLLLDKSFGRSDRIMEWLGSENYLDKTVFIKIAGDLQLEEAVPRLLEMISQSDDKEVLLAIINALGVIGSVAAVPPLADFLYTDDPELTPAAVSALSKTGGSTAVKRLSEALGRDGEIDIIILDALAAIQDQLALRKINEMLMSHFARIRNRAKDHLSKIGTKTVPILVENLKERDPDLLIHSLNILGLIGDESAAPAVRKMLNDDHPDSNVRFAAYEALGLIPSSRSAIRLANGLNDPEEQVRLAAARAIDRNLSDVLLSGIKNLLTNGDYGAQNLVVTLLNAEADNIFNKLIDWELFQGQVVDYLPKKAHPQIRDHFLAILKKRKKDSLAQLIAGGKDRGREKGLMIYAVDDSRMMLNIYMKKLSQLDYESATFQFPDRALKAVKEKKPDLVITDLNMPEINGLQLTEQIRQWYDSSKLPIIMITTQNDLQDMETAHKVGVDVILKKPFEDKELAETIRTLTGT